MDTLEQYTKGIEMEMKRLNLDLESFTQEDLKNYQELFVETISNLKNGLFNAQASLGLHNSLNLLSDFHLQVSKRLKDIQVTLADIPVETEFISEDK